MMTADPCGDNLTQTCEPLRFEDAPPGDFVELRLVYETPELVIVARVRTCGFAAVVESMILRPEWDSFCAGLKQLEKNRQGSATLEAISPGELELEVRSTNRAGQMAIGGLIGTDLSGSRVRMTFSPIPFDPSSLPQLVRVAQSWNATLTPPKARWSAPTKCGEWRGLSEEEKWSWLQGVRDAYFAKAKRNAPPRIPGRTVTLEGDLIEDVASFYCALGEAVNGPGGYFGAHTIALYDALHGGFGLDAPCTIRWRDSHASQLVLDSAALVRELKRNETIAELILGDMAEPANATTLALLAQAEAGTRTIFDELVGLIRSASQGEIHLILE